MVSTLRFSLLLASNAALVSLLAAVRVTVVCFEASVVGAAATVVVATASPELFVVMVGAADATATPAHLSSTSVVFALWS